MKKFVFVVIPTIENAYHSLKDFVEIAIPYGMASVAGVVEKLGYEAVIIDGDAENLTFQDTIERVIRENPDFVGSTCMTATMDTTTKFYDKLKESLPACKVIVGGPHVSALPTRTLRECNSIDYVIKGEGEEAIEELLNGMENGIDPESIKGLCFRKGERIVETRPREPIADLGKLPIPAYHLLKYGLYRSYGWNAWTSGHRKPLGTMFTGRGCMGNCNFCASQAVFGHSVRYFPLQRIKEELDILVEKYGIKILYFEDDTFPANRNVVNKVCDYIIEKGYHRRLEIMVSSRTDTAHLPTLNKMRKAGVRWICFGVESGNQRILDIMRKNTTIQEIRDAFKKAKEAGIYAAGNYIIGCLGETYATAVDTIRLACELEQYYASFSVAIPLPGTDLYRHCVEKGIKLPPWNDFGSVNSPPIAFNDSLDAGKLMELRRIATNRFFKRPGYILKLLRTFNAMTVLKDFAKMYFSLRREIKENRF
ncbi:MAG: B12-binding domain-containing radical SAM protein [Candidatus Omnitrophica bacterium]|nr:B12-binding domain-containing radical SAM protein [Candidatus Omnitrophota bacterium]